MGCGHDLIGRSGKLCLDFVEVDRLPKRRSQHRHLGTVACEQVLEPVSENACAEYKCPITGFNEVRSCRIHRQGSRSRQDEGLCVCGVEYLTHPLEGSAEDFDKIGRDMTGGRCAERLEHIRFELNGSWNHQ